MKNKLYFLLLGLLVSFSFMNGVFAADFKFSMAADVDKSEVAKAGDVATITVTLKSDVVVYGCSFGLEESGDVVFNSKEAYSGLTFASGNERMSLEPISDLGGINAKNGVQLFNLKYKVNGNGSVKIKNITCTSAESTPRNSSVSDISVDLKIKDYTNITTLSKLSVSGGQMTPAFSSNNLNYNVKLENSTFSLTMSATNEKYQNNIKVTDGEGNVLNPSNINFDNHGGQNIMNVLITVTGENSDSKTQYSLLLNYEQKELDNSLASLKVAGKDITLETGKTNYEITVDSGTKFFDVEATLKDSENFQFKVGNEPGRVNMNSDVVAVALIVEPKSNTTGAESITYTLKVSRKKNSGGGTGNNEKPSGGSVGTGSNGNPETGDVPMFLMAFILIASLVGSIILYRKNLEGYSE